jgi:hypothetical protein
MLTKPGVLLQVEGGCVLLAAILSYARVLHGSWWTFAAFFLAPDLSLLGYLAKRHLAMAAALYNAVHSYMLPIALGIAGWWMGSRPAEAAALIWIAHIAFDRLLGFGLKFRKGFKPTHVQRAGVWGY